MSERWIKICHETRRKPEVVQIARGLQISGRHGRQTVVGMLIDMWIVFDEQTRDGLLSGWSADDMDAEIGMPGFTKAVAAVGWLDVIDEGLRMPLFEEHTSASAKLRASDARRKRMQRQALPDRPATSRKDPDKRPAETGHQPGPDKKRLEKKNTTGPEDAGPDRDFSKSIWTQAMQARATERGKPLPEPLLQPIHPTAGAPDKPRQCWTAACGWDDRHLASLADPHLRPSARSAIWDWYRRQLAAPDPAVPDATGAAAVAVLALAEEAAKRGGITNRVAWFRSAVSGRLKGKAPSDLIAELDGKAVQTAAKFVVEAVQ